jgi:hypothetical protein
VRISSRFPLILIATGGHPSISLDSGRVDRRPEVSEWRCRPEVVMGTSAAAQKQQRTGKARAASRGIRHRVLPRRKEVLLHWPTRLRHSCFFSVLLFSVLLFSVFLFSCLLGLMPEAPTGWRGMSAGKPEMPRSLRSIGPGQSRLAPKNFPFAGETACRGWLLPGSRFAACTAPLFEASG